MPRQGLGHSSVDIYNMVTPGTDDPVWRNKTSGQLMVGYQQSRSNFVLFSQDATDAEAWTKGNTAIDSTLYEAPDNSTTANAIKSDSTGSKNYKITQSSLSVTAGKTYTTSVHVKKGTLGFARIKSHDSSTPFRADFNLTTGAVTNTTNTISTQVDVMDDDWYRCSITFQATATTSSAYVEVFACAANGDTTPNVAVSGVVLLYAWGWQLEENSEMSAYIVTTNAARTTTETLNDTSETWDFDSADLMPEADPDDDGVWEVPANIVLNGDYEELGSELVTNGDFATDSDWSKGTGVTISDGKANWTNTANNVGVTQSGIITSGKTYKISYTVSNYSSGSIRVRYPFISDRITANGTYTATAEATSTDLYMQGETSGDANVNLSIDNVSVKQVDPNDRWQLQYTGTGDWSITDKLNFENVNGGSAQLNVFEVGATYEITVDYVFTSGTRLILPYDGSNFPTGGVITTTGSVNGYTYYYTPSNTSLLIYSDGNGNGSIDNVTVREYAIQPQDV